MEVIIGLLVLFLLLPIIGLMLLGAFGIGWFATSGKRDARQKTEAPALLDAAFDGRPTATFSLSSLRSYPTKEDVIQGAAERGYRFAGSSDEKYGSTMVFEKIGEGTVESR